MVARGYVTDVDTFASRIRDLTGRIATLERAAKSAGGGGGVPSDWTPYDDRYVNVTG